MNWINIKEKTPSLEDIGKEFLVAVKTAARHKYQIAEWFSSVRGKDISSEDNEPYFLIDVPWCGQHALNVEVTHWAELIDLPSDEDN